MPSSFLPSSHGPAAAQAGLGTSCECLWPQCPEMLHLCWGERAARCSHGRDANAASGRGSVCSPPASGHAASPRPWHPALLSAAVCLQNPPGGQDLPVWNENQKLACTCAREELAQRPQEDAVFTRVERRKGAPGETKHWQRPNVQCWVCKLTCSAVC